MMFDPTQGTILIVRIALITGIDRSITEELDLGENDADSSRVLCYNNILNTIKKRHSKSSLL